MASLVNHSVTNLINGVSEQAPSVRLDNQLEEQINCFSDVTRGLTRRNALELKKITPIDIADTFKIEFSIDGIRHMVALNGNHPTTPLQYVSLSADVDALGVALTEGQYFKEMSRNDLQIVEDKEKVYLLNRKQIVGDGSDRTTYFDIKLIRGDTYVTDTLWDTGEYTLQFQGLVDPTSPPAVGSIVSVVINRTTTLQDIANTINGNAAFVAEAGVCTVTGTISNYRITFAEIPTGWVFPVLVTAVVTPVTQTVDVEEDSGWLYTYHLPSYIYHQSPSAHYQQWFMYGFSANVPKDATEYTSGGYTYYRGSLRRSYTDGRREYAIKRFRVVSHQISYELDTFSPSTTQEDGAGSVDYTSKAMIWVTGVSLNQTYDTTVTYYAIADPPTLLTATSSTSVGTTASNIKLNWVATDIKTDYDAATHFTAEVYDNAVLVTAVSGYAISKVEVTNNYDISSIKGVTEATKDNTGAIQSIEDLPPSFADDFKVRVGTTSDDKSNYYMKYKSGFKGWKEAALNESRFLDRTTLPYIIDKAKVKETGVITIEPATWAQSLAGDSKSNKDPSFLGRTINDLFFYGSRLGLATDDTLVLSEIDEHDMFFRTTASQTKKSDRVDIKLDSSKIGYDPIKHVITYDGKLFINTGSNQSILLVNTAFDLTTARLTEVSSYSLGDNRPMPVGSGLYFANTTDNVTNIFNYIPVGNGVYEAIELTKHCPRYLQGSFKRMAYSSDVTVVSTFDDKRTLFVQNRYSTGGQQVQNSWHKWTVPYDVEHFYFHKNTLYVIMSAENKLAVKHTIVTQYVLKPNDVQNIEDEVYIGWRPLLDCWTKDKTLIDTFNEFQGVNDKLGQSFETVTLAYDSTYREQIDLGTPSTPTLEKVTPPMYYWQVVGDTNTVVFNGGTPIVFGNNTITYFDDGGYRYFKGETDDGTGHFEVSRSTITPVTYYLDEVLYGIPFQSKITLSPIIARQQGQDGFITMNYANLMLRRMRLLLSKSGLFNVTLDFKDRADYTVKYTGLPLGEFVIGRGTVSDINFDFPINCKSERITIRIETQDSTPFNLLATEWQGQLINKGRQI